MTLRIRKRVRDYRAENSKRNEYGCIVSVREQSSGDVRSLHAPGLRMEALQTICELLDRTEGDWKVVGYSTPETIVFDLKGKRHGGGHKDSPAHIAFPEARVLAGIGRLDLLDPSLQRSDHRHYRRRA